MKKPEEKKLITKQFKNIKAHIKCFLTSADQEELHQFRVGVKKLQALLMLLQQNTGNHKLLKRFKPVGKIFKKAGNIRGAYINLKLSDQYQFNNKPFVNEQTALINSDTQSFYKQGEKNISRIKQARKNIAGNLHRLGKKDIKQFYRDNLEVVSAYMQEPDFGENMHQCRKIIKLLLYNQKIIGKATGAKLQVNTSYLDKLQSSIGAWHDNVLAINLLAKNAQNNKSILYKLKRENNNLKKRIVTLGNNFMLKVKQYPQFKEAIDAVYQ